MVANFTYLYLQEKISILKCKDKSSNLLNERREFIVECKHRNKFVAATDLFPFANQCPRQESHSLTDQSTGRAHEFLLPLKNYFF